MARTVDYLDLATRRPREEFVVRHPFFFLVGDALLAPPEPAVRADSLGAFEPDEDMTGATRLHETQPPGSKKAFTLVLAVRKVQEQFPSMITVGRTSNNDIVIPDIDVSRFHAFFRVREDRVEVADAGSANGSFVAGVKLATKGAPRLVVPGERITFAHLAFTFLDAGAAWDQVRAVDLDA